MLFPKDVSVRQTAASGSMNKFDVNLPEGVAREELGKGKGLGLAHPAEGTFLGSFFLNPDCVSGLPTRLIPGSPPVMRVRRKQEGSSSRGDHPPPSKPLSPCPGLGAAHKESLTLTTFCLLPLPGKSYGADDFLPVLMYVLARSNLTEMLLNVEYMMELMDPALQLGEGESPPQAHLRNPGAHRPLMTQPHQGLAGGPNKHLLDARLH